MTEKLLIELKKRMDCLVLLNCLKNSSEKERLKIAVNCLGLREAARLLGKDSGNLSRYIKKNKKRGKNAKKEKRI